MNQFFGTLALAPVEHVLNQCIARDRQMQQCMRPFCGKVLEITSTAPKAVLTIRFLEAKIRLSALPAATLNITADASINAPATRLLEALLDTRSKGLANPDIVITGDGLLLQDILVAMRAMDIDWRDYLAPLLGDVATQEIGQMTTQVHNWQQQAQSNLKRSVNDYVKYELNLVPDGSETDLFSDQLDRLKLALDRSTARAALLQERLDKSLKNQQLTS